MWCLKCGKDTKNEQVFCPQCLAGMENYPVKPDVHIQLPNRSNQNIAKKGAKKKRAPSPEEMVDMLRKRNRRLLVIILMLILLLTVAAYALTQGAEPAEIIDNLGKNYTVETSAK